MSDRVPIQLTADPECRRCKGTGIITTRHYVGEMRIGGPPQQHYNTTGLCSCVTSRSELCPK